MERVVGVSGRTATRRTPAHVAAQVAVEACVNHPDDFELETLVAVLEFAETLVAPLYVDMLRNEIERWENDPN